MFKIFIGTALILGLKLEPINYWFVGLALCVIIDWWVISEDQSRKFDAIYRLRDQLNERLEVIIEKLP